MNSTEACAGPSSINPRVLRTIIRSTLLFLPSAASPLLAEDLEDRAASQRNQVQVPVWPSVDVGDDTEVFAR
jgi:hypothetical protein